MTDLENKSHFEVEPQLPHDLMQKAEEEASEYLKRGRDWDVDHTKAVVYYATRIAVAENENARVLATAAWFHDTGYAGLFSENSSSDPQVIKRKKPEHMVLGA